MITNRNPEKSITFKGIQTENIPLRPQQLCLNFVEDGKCHVDGRSCILGSRGATARNENHECELQGVFDVWISQGSVLVTDLGFPPDEPVQSVALGVNETVAMTTGLEKSKERGIPMTTTKRECIQCGALYWVSQHVRTSGLTRRGFVTFCPDCLGGLDRPEVENRLGLNRHWCG